MIVFAAIVPHSPLLIPSIGKEHREKLDATIAAFAEIEQALYLTKADTLCIIAPHGIRYTDAYSINLNKTYIGTFKTFGDFSTMVTAKSDFLLIDHIQRKMRVEGVPFTLTSNEEIDYGFSVPIALLTTHLTDWKLIPVTPSMHDGKSHFEFGVGLKRILHAEQRRVAVIASADLSHKVNEFSTGGSTEAGIAFDQTVCDAASRNDATPLMALGPDVTETVAQCGYRPILVLLGAINEINVKPKQVCYEAPFGVGYLTVRYDVA